MSTTLVGDAGSSKAANGSAALEAREVTVRFGGLTALNEVSIDVPARSIVGLVGPNGAGKSTLLGVLSGLLRPNSGSVWLGGNDVTNSSVRSRSAMGIARTFQQPELFMGLTVREHLVVARRARVSPHRLWRDMFDPRFLLPNDRRDGDGLDELLELLRLTEVADAPVAALPLGILRLVEVGRALACDPTVLLLDEPLSGLDIKAAESLLGVFRQIVAGSDRGLSLVLVEHDVAAVLALSDTVVVLDFGEQIAVGTPEVIRQNPEVRSAYLGDGGRATPVDRRAEGSPASVEPEPHR